MRSAWSTTTEPQQTTWVGWCATCVLGHLHTSFDGTSFEVELKTALEMCALAADPGRGLGERRTASPRHPHRGGSVNWWSVRTCDCGEVVHQVEPGAPYLDRYGDRHPPHNEDVATPTESET